MTVAIAELATLPLPSFDAKDVQDMRWALEHLARDLDDAERVDQLAALHQLKAAVAAAEARVLVDLAAGGEGSCSGGADRPRRGVAEQVGLVTQSSPATVRVRLGRARVLVADLRCTLAAMQAGQVQPGAAEAVLRETSQLTSAQRRMVDAALVARLPQLPVGQVGQAARKVAQQVDPGGALRRITAAEADRCVWVRQAADGMVQLGARLPIAAGVATYAALVAAADTAATSTATTSTAAEPATDATDADAGTDAVEAVPRSRAQLMADTLVERVTGASSATGIPVEVGLLINADALLADTGPTTGPEATGDNLTCVVQGPGGGPMPAGWGRRLLTGDQRAWLRRLITDPIDGTVTAIDTRRRAFTGSLRRLILARDQVCRTPYCTASIRHIDHVVAFADGGPTNLANGQGLCESCNYTKNEPGWSHDVTAPGHPPGQRSPAGAHRVQIITPTGHTANSRPPPALGYPYRC